MSSAFGIYLVVSKAVYPQRGKQAQEQTLDHAPAFRTPQMARVRALPFRHWPLASLTFVLERSKSVIRPRHPVFHTVYHGLDSAAVDQEKVKSCRTYFVVECSHILVS